MGKNKHPLFLSAIHDRSRLLITTVWIILTITNSLSFKAFGQSQAEKQILNQKALVLKYRVDYDSAIFYYRKLVDLNSTTGEQE